MISKTEINGIKERPCFLKVNIPLTKELNIFIETFISTYKELYGTKVSKATVIQLMMDRGHDNVKNEIFEALDRIEKIKKLQL